MRSIVKTSPDDPILSARNRLQYSHCFLNYAKTPGRSSQLSLLESAYVAPPADPLNGQEIDSSTAINKRPIEALIPLARNARTHSDAQVAQIAANIMAFGWTNPILADGTNGIIPGHGRLLAARQLGLAQVSVIELAHLTPTQKRAYVIADNRLAENASRDEDLRKLELAELRDAEFDLDLPPTMKPVALVERAIRNSSKSRDLIGGSGTTMIAAEKSGRRAPLIELGPKYVDVIVRRWQDHTG